MFKVFLAGLSLHLPLVNVWSQATAVPLAWAGSAHPAYLTLSAWAPAHRAKAMPLLPVLLLSIAQLGRKRAVSYT